MKLNRALRVRRKVRHNPPLMSSDPASGFAHPLHGRNATFLREWASPSRASDTGRKLERDIDTEFRYSRELLVDNLEQGLVAGLILMPRNLVVDVEKEDLFFTRVILDRCESSFLILRA